MRFVPYPDNSSAFDPRQEPYALCEGRTYVALKG